MVPVLNRPFLEHTIAHLKKCPIGNITLAVRYLPEVVQNYFANGSNLGVKLTYAMEVVHSAPQGQLGRDSKLNWLNHNAAVFVTETEWLYGGNNASF